MSAELEVKRFIWNGQEQAVVLLSEHLAALSLERERWHNLELEIRDGYIAEVLKAETARDAYLQEREEARAVQDEMQVEIRKARVEGEEAGESRLYAFFDDDEYPEAQLRARLAFVTHRADKAESDLATLQARVSGVVEELERLGKAEAEQARERLRELGRYAGAQIHELHRGRSQANRNAATLLRDLPELATQGGDADAPSGRNDSRPAESTDVAGAGLDDGSGPENCTRCGAALNPKGGCPNEMQHVGEWLAPSTEAGREEADLDNFLGWVEENIRLLAVLETRSRITNGAETAYRAVANEIKRRMEAGK